MGSPKDWVIGRERRRSRRFQPTEGRDAAVFKLESQTKPALILNVSAEGFRVCVHAGITVEIGAVVKLDTCDGRHLVRIVNANEEGGKLYLGLERIHTLPPQRRVAPVRRSNRSGRLQQFDTFGLLAHLAEVGLLIVISLAILMATIDADGIRYMVQTLRRHIGP